MVAIDIIRLSKDAIIIAISYFAHGFCATNWNFGEFFIKNVVRSTR
jgi:hypothetical protein